jgi:hypothetical protein
MPYAKNKSVISVMLGVGTALFIILISLPPEQKPSDIQKNSGLSSVSGDIIEEEELTNSTDDNLPIGEYLNVKGSYSLSPDFENFENIPSL